MYCPNKSGNDSLKIVIPAEAGIQRIMKEDVIYHYTTEEGLRGILESQCLWATHFQYLNDTEEIQHILKQIEIYRRKLPKTETREFFCNFAVETISEFYLSKEKKKADFYVTCFSEDADSRTMWENSDWGFRYAICFCMDALNDLVASEKDFLMGAEPIRPVLYRMRDKQAALHHWKKEFAHVVFRNNMHDQVARNSMALRGICFPALFKNEDWKVQKEWRIIIRCPRTINEEIREQNKHRKEKRIYDAPKQHVRLFSDPAISGFSGLSNAVRGIIIGPKGNVDTAKAICAEYKLENVPIIPSRF